MSESIGRIHYLDAMRSVLMMLGIVLHTGQVFNPTRIWYVYYEPSSTVAGVVVGIIELFRMPTFFAVSGFFCVMTLTRYGAPGFLRVRVPRIALPLLVTALTLNSIQAVLLDASGVRPFDLAAYFRDGLWITHLWFLINLCIYFVLAAGVTMLAGKPVGRVGSKFATLLASLPWAVLLLLLPLTGIAVETLNKVGYPLFEKYLGRTIDVYMLTRYLPFFIFGALLYADRALLSRLTSAPWALLVGVPVVAWFLMPHAEAALPGALGRALYLFVQGLFTWSMLAGCFRVFEALFDKRSALWTYMSDASYTVYLFHHLIVLALAIVLLDSGLPPLVMMVLIIVITLAVTLAVHEFAIRRVPLLRLLFNGKRA